MSHLPLHFHHSAPAYAPPSFDPTADFLLGPSATYTDHEVHPYADPSVFTNATITDASNSSYPYPSSVWFPQPIFSYPAFPDAPPTAYPNKAPSPLVISSFAPSLATMTAPIPMLQTVHSAVATSLQSRIDDQHSSSSSTGSQSPRSGPSQPRSSGASGENKGKRHGCWMCHKSFDRPSTLRKHLLVHTGEKAFQCETCGRRFGVASNLNRHAKRCALRPVNASAAVKAAAAAAPPFTPASPTITGANTTDSAQPTDAAVKQPQPSISINRGRKRASISSDTTTSPSGSSSAVDPPKSKRRRRAPSPCRWVPDSLKHFDLTPHPKSTPTPLPPVHPFHDPRGEVWEERDSFDSASDRPYHPIGWRGKLPGPGVLSQEGSNGLAGGRLLVF